MDIVEAFGIDWPYYRDRPATPDLSRMDARQREAYRQKEIKRRADHWEACVRIRAQKRVVNELDRKYRNLDPDSISSSSRLEWIRAGQRLSYLQREEEKLRA